MVFNSCQHLESIKIWCGGEYFSEKKALETYVKYSSKNIRELILCYQDCYVWPGLLPEELETFFISWMNRIPQKSFYFVIIKYYYNSDNDNNNSLDTNDENMKIIEKYINLGVIKKFKIY